MAGQSHLNNPIQNTQKILVVPPSFETLGMEALEDLRRHDYLDLVEAQFLLDRLNATADDQEQTTSLRLMREIKKPLPVDALMAILADAETTSIFLRMEIASPRRQTSANSSSLL
ncbi:hypothetical protein KSC_032680 [Ktedonobacter sp. SOSP1-52]|uniref:hypothetical protein n=1 Tax=Ktedonobacter sp. SOSP1-52 TaxID=2778366 RepID=UPI0019162AB4|nr:hypothetical protein [Ktedonobacter sp. SOSP1-52]GHO64376.1 hypothetical protein KSC_032680 [Ktedonobacter sp. SOSP1-52]